MKAALLGRSIFPNGKAWFAQQQVFAPSCSTIILSLFVLEFFLSLESIVPYSLPKTIKLKIDEEHTYIEN